MSNFTAKPGEPECAGPDALIELDEPGMKDERMTVQNPDLGLIIREERTVRNPVCKTQPTLVWMKSIETNRFSLIAAHAGRGVAELLVDPVSQGWRTKPNQKEFLKKMSGIDELSWIDEFSWFSEFEKISWFGEKPWIDEISGVEEISWYDVIFLFETSWLDELSWYKWNPEKDELSSGLRDLNLKKFNIQNVSKGSDWIRGLKWMKGERSHAVFHGWRREMRLAGYMQRWRTKYWHNKHLIQDDNCRIFLLGENR